MPRTSHTDLPGHCGRLWSDRLDVRQRPAPMWLGLHPRCAGRPPRVCVYRDTESLQSRPGRRPPRLSFVRCMQSSHISHTTPSCSPSRQSRKRVPPRSGEAGVLDVSRPPRIPASGCSAQGNSVLDVVEPKPESPSEETPLARPGYSVSTHRSPAYSRLDIETLGSR